MDEEVEIKKTNKLKKIAIKIFVENAGLKAFAIVLGFLAWFLANLI